MERAIWKFVCLTVALAGILPGFAAAETKACLCRSQAEADHRRFEVDQYAEGSVSYFAFGVLPCLETPSVQGRIHGFRFNLFAGEHLDVYGVDLALVSNYVTREFGGLQIALAYNDIWESCGAVQLSGVLNRCNGTMHGLQFGLCNLAEEGDGLQIGLLNYGNDYHGLQLGVVNIIRASAVPVLPFLNFAF